MESWQFQFKVFSILSLITFYFLGGSRSNEPDFAIIPSQQFISDTKFPCCCRNLYSLYKKVDFVNLLKKSTKSFEALYKSHL